MNHPKLGRKKGHRNQLIKNLAGSRIIYERITTTAAKAKAVKGYVEHIIASAQKADDVNGLRMAIAALGQKKPAQKVVEVFKKLYGTPRSDTSGTRDIPSEVPPTTGRRRDKGQSGGYLRIIKLGERRGDNAPIVIIEFTRKSEQLLKAQKEKSDKSASKPASDTKSAAAAEKPTNNKKEVSSRP